MGRVGYNPFEGILRLATAGDKEPDPFVTDVLVYHAALEAEIDEMLKRSLPRADKLFQRSSQFGFQNKVTVLAAAWQGDEESGDQLSRALIKFNDLRNAVAHNDQLGGRKKALKNLRQACSVIAPWISEQSGVLEMAIGICQFLGDDKSGKDYLAPLEVLDQALNKHVPKALVADDA